MSHVKHGSHLLDLLLESRAGPSTARGAVHTWHRRPFAGAPGRHRPAVDDIPLDPAYTWAAVRARGVTRAQIREDGQRIARGLYLTRALEPDLAARCRAWMRVLPD